jgi:hypothetical protein
MTVASDVPAQRRPEGPSCRREHAAFGSRAWVLIGRLDTIPADALARILRGRDDLFEDAMKTAPATMPSAEQK